MTLEKLKEELIEDIIVVNILENIYGCHLIHGQQLTSNCITQIIKDKFDEYECENKVGVYANKEN